jgi:hypothetical protein
LGITPEDLTLHHPCLYHMAERGTWQSISEHGLLSTTALLDMYGIDGEERRLIEGCRRPESVTIRRNGYDTVVVRDQKPMSEGALRKCLKGMTPFEWYRLLNGKVFFWLTSERVTRLLSARAYREREHTVLTIDTAKLLERHIRDVTLSPINSGSTVYNPQPRDAATFQAPASYPFDAWRNKRGAATKAIAELAVHYAVPTISEMVIRVERRRESRVLETIYER